jgi:hypothetical protein
VYKDNKVFVCDGVTTNCYVYDKDNDKDNNWKWKAIGPLNAVRTHGFAVLIPSRDSEPKFTMESCTNYGWRDDWVWWYSGGLPDTNSIGSSDILEHGAWNVSVDLPFANGINYHCKVQISHCETALIGGFSQQGSTITVSNAVS